MKLFYMFVTVAAVSGISGYYLGNKPVEVSYSHEDVQALTELQNGALLPVSAKARLKTQQAQALAYVWGIQ